MEWKVLSKTEAKEKFIEMYNDNDQSLYNRMNNYSEYLNSECDLNDDYRDLRAEVFNKYKTIVNGDNAQRMAYKLDAQLAVFLYSALNSYGMNIRYAGTDEVWYYLNTIVFPDILYFRWGLNDDRYWRNKQRLYLKTLWWYVHLAARFKNGEFDEAETLKILQGKGMGTDSLAQVVERTGTLGYRIDLMRCIMYQFYLTVNAPNSTVRNASEYFRGIMKLVTSRTFSVNPVLSSFNEQYGLETFTKRLLKDTKRGCVITIKR